MQLTPQDQQLISAYLDGQLSQQEKAHLETRLATQPVLRTELESLRRTRALLRLTPQRRAPRNYTLKPEWVPARHTGFQWVRTLRLSSALASLMAVIMIAFNLLPIGGGVMLRASAPEMTAANDAFQAPEYQYQIQAVGEAQPTPMMLVWGDTSQPAGVGGKGGGPAENPPRDLAPAATPQPEVNSAAIEPTPLIANLPPIEGSGPILGVRPTEEAGQIQRQDETASAKDGTVEDQTAVMGYGQRVPNTPESDNRWIIPGALLIVALFTAGLAIFLQRKRI